MTPTKSTRAQHTTWAGPMLDGRRDDSMRVFGAWRLVIRHTVERQWRWK